VTIIYAYFLALEKGYIRETELDAFFDHLLAKSGTEVSTHSIEHLRMCLSKIRATESCADLNLNPV
jgi:hypothetical protein